MQDTGSESGGLLELVEMHRSRQRHTGLSHPNTAAWSSAAYNAIVFHDVKERGPKKASNVTDSDDDGHESGF